MPGECGIFAHGQSVAGTKESSGGPERHSMSGFATASGGRLLRHHRCHAPNRRGSSARMELTARTKRSRHHSAEFSLRSSGLSAPRYFARPAPALLVQERRGAEVRVRSESAHESARRGIAYSGALRRKPIDQTARCLHNFRSRPGCDWARRQRDLTMIWPRRAPAQSPKAHQGVGLIGTGPMLAQTARSLQ